MSSPEGIFGLAACKKKVLCFFSASLKVYSTKTCGPLRLERLRLYCFFQLDSQRHVFAYPKTRRRKHKAIMMFKSLNGLGYLHELFSERHTDYDLRDSFRKLNLPKPRTNYLKRSFSYSGALLWNSLPESIRAIRSIGQFKKEINCELETFDSHSAFL